VRQIIANPAPVTVTVNPITADFEAHCSPGIKTVS
jgi:hypothetical protein